jgi:hypothetical protein
VDWSLNGGTVIFGAAGVAVSRRILEMREREIELEGTEGGVRVDSQEEIQVWHEGSFGECECERCLRDAVGRDRLGNGLWVIDEDLSGEEREAMR